MVLQTGNITNRKYKESVHIMRSVNPAWTSLPSEHPLLQQKSENHNSVQCKLRVWKLYLYTDTKRRVCLHSDDLCSDSSLILTIGMKNCMGRGDRPHVDGVFSMFLMFALTLADGLWCARFIYPILCWCWHPDIKTSSVYRAQMSRLFIWWRRQNPVSGTLF
jgi:hypothetical protein